MKSLEKVLIHLDDHLLAVNKAAGMLSIPDRFNDQLPSLRSLLTKKYGEIYVVHRLDRDTSGCILFARSSECHAALNQMFREGQIYKEYHAICHGTPNPQVIAKSIAPHSTKKGKFIVHSSGKPSLSEIIESEKLGKYSLCRILLRTGRTHQIRVHLSSISCPILADQLYGVEGEFYLSAIKKSYRNSSNPERPLLNRQALHAASLQFEHPILNQNLEIRAEWPKDFRAVVNQLRKQIG